MIYDCGEALHRSSKRIDDGLPTSEADIEPIGEGSAPDLHPIHELIHPIHELISATANVMIEDGPLSNFLVRNYSA